MVEEKTGNQQKKLKVSQLLEIDREMNSLLGFRILAGERNLDRLISCIEVDRPGLPLNGFFDHFGENRIQLLGKGETAYIRQLCLDNKTENIERFFSYRFPLCIVSSGLDIPEEIIHLSERYEVPLIQSPEESEKIIQTLGTILQEYFAPSVTIHGNLVSVFNKGVLITGKSGIGKSESVLGIIERGHRFISDDIVTIKKIQTPKGSILRGQPHINLGPFLEIRGIGIVNLSHYFGEGKFLDQEEIRLVVELQEWEPSRDYERLGIDTRYQKILGIDIPKKEIPVTASRNIPLLIEMAVSHEILNQKGINSGNELNDLIIRQMQKS